MVLVTASHFHPSLIFASKAGANLSGPPYRTPLKVYVPSLAR